MHEKVYFTVFFFNLSNLCDHLLSLQDIDIFYWADASIEGNIWRQCCKFR